jgi:hypothetical protein
MLGMLEDRITEEFYDPPTLLRLDFYEVSKG